VKLFVHKPHRWTDRAKSNVIVVFNPGEAKEVDGGLGAAMLLDHPTKFCEVSPSLEDGDGDHYCKQKPAVVEDTSVAEVPNTAMPAPGKPSPQRKRQAQATRKRSNRARRAGVGQSV
jgi:hypothetical protein